MKATIVVETRPQLRLLLSVQEAIYLLEALRKLPVDRSILLPGLSKVLDTFVTAHKQDQGTTSEGFSITHKDI